MRAFWTTWGSLTQRVVVLLMSSSASFVGIYLAFEQQPLKFEGAVRGLIFLAATLAILALILEFVSERRLHSRNKVYRKHDEAGIKDYMQRWISESGRAAIWTRDLSWVNDDKTRSILLTKAKGGNLVLCMPKMNSIGEKLKAAGAAVYIYGSHEFHSPGSRFTIAYSGNGGSRVAIARPDDNMHLIEEFDSNDPVFHLACDLVQLAEQAWKRGQSYA